MIRMYMGNSEHNPPHIHVSYQDYKASFDFIDNKMTKGELPSKQFRLVQAWIELHKEDLLADGELAQSGETPFKIEPLR
jgi:predicted RNase H-like HicB family nuclease